MKINYKSELEKAKKEIVELKKRLERAKVLIAQLIKDSDNGAEL